MTLPNFLGIGAPRAGTTWLNTLLPSHPDVFTPTLRDEIRYFDRYYDRGVAWYKSLFPPPEEAVRYRAIGEISPQYLACEDCPERIHALIPDCKMIVLMRHPVNRAYSQYGLYVQRRHYRGSFEEFVAEKPGSLKRGFYGSFFSRYLKFFARDQILALVFEDAVSDVSGTKNELANFLDISVDKFPSQAGNEKVNPSTIPTRQFLYGAVAKTGRQFRRWNLEPIVDFVMRTSLQRYLGKGRSLPPLDENLKTELSHLFLQDFDEIERCLQIDLSSWRT
jgi:hypothetical protein